MLAFPPQIVAGQWKGTAYEGSYKIKSLGYHTSPGAGVKRHYQATCFSICAIAPQKRVERLTIRGERPREARQCHQQQEEEGPEAKTYMGIK